MTTPTLTVKLSPSGKKLGSLPYQVGPGSTSLVFRAHGDHSGGPIPLNNGTAGTYVPGLGGDLAGASGGATFSAIMRPGYRYEVKLDYVVQTLSPTADPIWTTYFRVRNAVAGTWGSWVPMNYGGGPANLLYSPQASTNYHKAWATEDYIDFTVSATTDAIQFMMTCDAVGTLEVFGNQSFARVEEYMPP